MVAQAIATARAAGATGQILVRGDSAYGNRAVVRACRRGNAEFSLVMTKNPAIARAIAAIPDTAWTPVRYPGAVQDPDTGAWISDAEVAEVPYTAFAHTNDRITARLVVRRVKDARRARGIIGSASTTPTRMGEGRHHNTASTRSLSRSWPAKPGAWSGCCPTIRGARRAAAASSYESGSKHQCGTTSPDRRPPIFIHPGRPHQRP
jgi:hypothetical protein